ncbi:MAG: homoserine dehydrogenase [Actinomycetota bacterium]|nr:homoserine dehydrogenase [Actinomycetota bacterium]
MNHGPVRIGLLGAGVVGGALIELIQREHDTLQARTGLDLRISRVAVSSVGQSRRFSLPPGVLVGDPMAVAIADDVDVVVELIGGLDPAQQLVMAALAAGKPVVTANKELIATAGSSLAAAATAAGVDLLFEAAVGGAIPLVRPLRESLAGERVTRVMGIVNGTTNYVLTRMSEASSSYHDAVAEAQRLGYAERDPTADVEGHDAAAKAAILATLAFGIEVTASDVAREGITDLRQDDVADARRLGYEVKLLALAERLDRPTVPDSGRSGNDPAAHELSHYVSVRVYPAMVPRSHPLAAVRGAHNAVFIEGAAVGELMLYGRGAGGTPTAAAVLGDLIDAAHNRLNRTSSRAHVARRVPLASAAEQKSAFYVSIDVMDRPGVLAAVAGIFGQHCVSIRSMEQIGLGDEARLVFLTHAAREADMATTLKDLEALPAVERVGVLLRVLGDTTREVFGDPRREGRDDPGRSSPDAGRADSGDAHRGA